MLEKQMLAKPLVTYVPGQLGLIPRRSRPIYILLQYSGDAVRFLCAFPFLALGIKRINIRKDVSAFYTCRVYLAAHFKRRQLTHVGVAF